MAITVSNTNIYEDVLYVDGVLKHNMIMERALHYRCKRYFDDHYKGVFFVGDEYKDEIFQEAFIKLWENIMNKKIYVEDGVLKGKGGVLFSGKLMTYFMSIAKYKYYEWTRQREYLTAVAAEKYRTEETEMLNSVLYENEDEIMLDIIADCMSQMPERCNQILTMYYYERKSLDLILTELSTFTSKDSLKTAKYKCMENLRMAASTIYHSYLNS